MNPRYQHVVLNTSRWETETIVEWLEYYRELGFDHVYLYCNDDDPLEMYERILPFVSGPNRFVTFHHMPFQGQQAACWMHFLENHKQECEWFMFVDADEFLALKRHPGIREFMSERELNFDCIHFNWIWFGPQEYEERPAGSTLLQFTRREDEQVQMNYFTKTITRSSAVDARLIGRPPVDMLNHRWPPTVRRGLREANVLGESMDEFYLDFPASAEQFMADIGRRQEILGTAVIHHYLFRSRADFRRRLRRGTLGAYYFQPLWAELTDRQDDWQFFIDRINAKEDNFLSNYWLNRSKRLRGQISSIIPLRPEGFANLALKSKPVQSSVSAWSNGDQTEDARGAISGIITGGDGFHTDIEECPWWETDLGAVKEIQEIRVFNSLKSPSFAARAHPLVIKMSLDAHNWQTVFDNEGDSPFGGADGHPLIVRVVGKARYIRLSLKSRDYFHLDEIEIYGA